MESFIEISNCNIVCLKSILLRYYCESVELYSLETSIESFIEAFIEISQFECRVICKIYYEADSLVTFIEASISITGKYIFVEFTIELYLLRNFY